jgi:hypothetical protein
MSLLTCRKIAVLKFTVSVLHEEKPKGVGAHFTSSKKQALFQEECTPPL